MNYEIQKAIKELNEFFEAHVRCPINKHIDHTALEADMLWDASRFWACVLFESEIPIRYKTKAQFEEFAKQYNRNNDASINCDVVYKRYWVRNILGYAEVSNNIRSLVSQFKELRKFKKELQFLSEFQKGLSKKSSTDVLITEVQDAARTYSMQCNIVLDEDGIFFVRWARKKDDQTVEFSPFDIYFDHFLEQWNYFDFLAQWIEQDSALWEKGMRISSQAFHSIHDRFKHFPKLPSIDDFKFEGLLHDDQESYYVDFGGTKAVFWDSLCSKICGYLWEKIIDEATYLNDKNRVFSFLPKALYWGRWPNHLKHVTPSARERFVEASCRLLLEQDDIKGCEREIEKLRIDSSDYRGTPIPSERVINRFSSFSINCKNPFELYLSLLQLEENARITYLYEQESREFLKFLVRSVVRHDQEHSTVFIETLHGTVPHLKYYPKIFELLENACGHPFLLWQVAQSVIRERPAVIPTLLVDLDYCTLGLCLIDELEFSAIDPYCLNNAWIKATKLLISNLPSPQTKCDEIAVVFFQLFRQLNKNKYKLPYRRDSEPETERRRANEMERETEVLALLENVPIERNIVDRHFREYLLPVIFAPLLRTFIQFEEKPFYRNGTIQFPMVKWNGLFWLIKATTYWKYKKQFPDGIEKRRDIANNFLRQYLENLERREVTKFELDSKEDVKAVPLWSEKIERLELLDWIYPVYAIFEIGQLGNFLAPRFEFRVASNEYDEANSFNSDKLRTHLGVMLQVLRKLVLPSVPFGFDRDHLLEIKKRLEAQIIDFIKEHSIESPSQGRVDIFSFRKEWQYQQSDREALLPQLAQAVDWFTDKKGIIDALVSTGDVMKMLTLLDYLKAEGIRKMLVQRIAALDIVDFLHGKFWLPEIYLILDKIIHYPELAAEVEKAIPALSEKVTGRKLQVEYEEKLFIAQLLVAYFKNDINRLEDVPIPVSIAKPMSEISLDGYKDFYRGLFYIKSEPEKAVRFFDQLASRYPKYPTIALNRLVAKINLGANSKDQAIYQEAYEEWTGQVEEYFNSRELERLEPDVSSNLMTILLALDRHDKIEELFVKLNLPDKMNSHVLDVRIHSLVKQKRTAEGLALLDSAKTYHQFTGEAEIMFLNDLENLISGVDNVEELRMNYQLIVRSSPSKLIRILPESFNGKQEIHEFLVKEIVNASDKMLEKIKSIDKIDDEDKYNDLVELVLDARLNNLGWHVDAQSRGGHSSGTVQPGERDIPICDANKKVLLVCEAQIFRGMSNTPSHLQKTFNYHHQKEAFAILLYDNGTIKKGFDSNWKEYLENILPDVKLPHGMEISTAAIDVSKDYDCESSAIKVAKSVHGSKTILYHIFVNINYRLTP